MTMRILLADDHDVVRRGLREFLEQQPGWDVCGEAQDGREAVEMATRLVPHVAVLDLMMPHLNGLEATKLIRQAQPSTEVLILTMRDSEELVGRALAAGARGYLFKSNALSSIVTAIETLATHRPYFDAKVSQLILDRFLASVTQEEDRSLTLREREIVQLLSEGNNTKQIARLLDLKEKTVETHRANIMAKLRARSVVDIVRYAVRNNLVGL